jgi:hypothetical protein
MPKKEKNVNIKVQKKGKGKLAFGGKIRGKRFFKSEEICIWLSCEGKKNTFVAGIRGKIHK